MNRVRLLNTEVDNVTMEEAVKAVCTLASQSSPSYVVTPNIDHIVLIEKDPDFKRAYKDATLRFVDGQPLVMFSKIHGDPLVEKVSGSDLFLEICREAANTGLSIFILGGKDGVAKRAANNLKIQFPRLVIKGTLSPRFGFERDESEIDNIISSIKSVAPDILFVCLGTPKAEKFIHQYYRQIEVPVSLSVGAAVDFTAGSVSRAPSWISKIGFEWLYRVLKEPRRLAKRYLNDFVNIVPIILKNW